MTPGPSGAAPRPLRGLKGPRPAGPGEFASGGTVPLGFPCDTQGAFLGTPRVYPASDGDDDGDGGRRARARPVLPLNGDLRQEHFQSLLLPEFPCAGAEGLQG